MFIDYLFTCFQSQIILNLYSTTKESIATMFNSQLTELELNSQSAEVSPTGQFNFLDQVRVATSTSFALHVVAIPQPMQHLALTLGGA